MGVIFMIESASKWFSQGIVEFFLNPWKFRNRGNETRVLFFAKKNKICWTKQRWITRAIDILNNIITQKVLTFYIFILELYFRINSLDEGVGIIFTIEMIFSKNCRTNARKFRNRGNESFIFRVQNLFNSVELFEQIFWIKIHCCSKIFYCFNFYFFYFLIFTAYFPIFTLELYNNNSSDEGVGIIFTIKSTSRWFSQRIVERKFRSKVSQFFDRE